MLNCGHCSARFPDANSLIKHLRNKCPNVRSLCDGASYKCGQDCYEKFDSLNTLRMHLNRTHMSSINLQNVNAVIPEQTLTVSDNNNSVCVNKVDRQDSGISNLSFKENETCTSDEVLDQNTSMRNNLKILNSETALLVSSFLADPLLPKSSVELFITSMSSYVAKVIPLILQDLSQAGQEQGSVRNCKTNVEGLVSDLTQSVHNFSNEYKWNKYFKGIGTYIEPEVYQTTTEPRHELIRGKRKQIIGTGQFIPLRFVLQKFLSIPGVLKSIDDYVECCLRSKVVTNIVCTSTWLSIIQLLENDVKMFPLFLYYDDYETGNPLGSHAGIHKLGAVYASIACLPPHLASQLKYIFLFALFYSSDRSKDGGNFNCFHKIIDELNFLSGTGIDLNIAGYFHGRVKFQLVSILGDNLGLHSILGFVENFTANYPCRFCRSHKSEIKTMCNEDLSTLRTESNYMSDLNLQNFTETGIKEESLWRKVIGFDMFKQVSVDIMHDILEGVARYAMVEVLKGLLSKKYFTLEDLNYRISFFNYGPDSNCKPPQFTETGANIKWKMSAMEAFNFIKYFPCFVSHKVPSEDQHWTFYLSLRKLLELAMTDAVHPEICDELRETVKEFNSLYMILSNSHLKPKFHHLVHYPGVMERLGPLPNLWSMRFEAKHRISKVSARTSCNRINLTKTLAIKHQLQLNHVFLKNEIAPNVEISNSRKIIKDPDIVNSLCSQFCLQFDVKIFSINFITINGIKYQEKTCITLNIDEISGEPNFIEITDILYDDDSKEVYFGGFSLETLFLDPHVCSYCVNKSNKKIYFSYGDMAYYKPNTLTKLPPYGWWYVVPRF